ncbi:D5 N like family protein [Glaesserella parasuis]|nr:D5 N like family protein [Glaesserella parasuis]MCT8766292.1 D5 N like family protein [Glaesserella parasuis]
MQQNTKLAPYFKAQSKQCNRLSDWLILVGEGAYYAYFDRKKQAGKGEQWQLIRDAYKFSTDRQPVILDSKSFAEIDSLFLAPTEQAFIKIFQVGEIPTLSEGNDLKNRILLNLSKHNPNVKTVEWLDVALQSENLTPHLERIRSGESVVEEILQKKGDEKVNIDLNQSTLTQKEILTAFLKWHAQPLRRDVVLGITYQFNGINWEVVSDEVLKRKCLDFYEAFDGDYTVHRLNRLAELITVKVKEMPVENPDYLGFQNGVLNKKTGEFLPHSEENFLRAIDPFECRTDCTNTPYFDDWLSFVSNGNQQKQDAILAGLYMILTNRHEWHLFLEATGEGGAGKSILGEIATVLNGKSNTAILDLKAFESEKGRAVLVGKTLAYSPDQKPYKGTADDLKAMTGGDPIKVKLLYKDELEIKVNAIFMMSTNYPITFTDRNGGITRRRVIILFDRKIPKEKKDVHFMEKVRAEIYGIVNKLLARFPDPEEARLILEEYQAQGEAVAVKREANHLVDFASAFKIDSNLKPSMMWGSNRTQKAEDIALFKAYLFYCECLRLQQPLNLQSFKQAFPDALRDSGQTEKLIEIGVKNGYTLLNIHWKDRITTVQRWENG